MEAADNSLSLAFEEGLYAAFLRDPRSVAEDWRRYFESAGPRPDGRHGAPHLGPSFHPSSIFHENGHRRAAGEQGPNAESAISLDLQHGVDQLVRNYRVRGHMAAQLDPLGQPRPLPPELDPAFCGLTDADLDRVFAFDSFGAGGGARRVNLTLQQIIQRLKNTYCRSIGAQFMHIDDLVVRQWLQVRMESAENRVQLTRGEQLRILRRLTDAVVFEEFIQRKYIGAKSFSLEGSETLIPLLDLAIEKGGEQGIQEIVLGMAHRGRLNVLANILGKPAEEIFREFEDAPALSRPGGDVRHHLGHSTDWQINSVEGRATTSGGGGGRTVHLSLCFNPSHLEFINPVALGRLRAKQDRAGDRRGNHGMAFLIHGDASFAGEGIVQEALNLSQLRAYQTGGALHVIVNNQIGFVTAPEEGRSSTYASDVAKMLQAPIFHVNGEDPEATAQVVRLAMDFRARFQRDVVIDMYCYRRRGHSEGDEPAFTQPLMYEAIKHRASVRETYLEHLLRMGGVTKQEADEMVRRKTEELEAALKRTSDVGFRISDLEEGQVNRGIWAGYRGGEDHADEDVKTGDDRGALGRLLAATARLPEGFHAHPKIQRWLTGRREMGEGKRPLDWAAAEALAFASLAAAGYRVRMSGQDSQRGTFSQRHAVLHDVQDGRIFAPLEHLTPQQAPVQIFNSPLSEAGVLGFEYGYSLDCPDGLVLWEAQYGDFANAGQVIIDQFITSAEKKWKRLSGLTLLLPHGQEGHGAEHSSARLERWLDLAAEHNIRVVYPTTPAQYFHCLRRQMMGKVRKPLVVLTPKSLLRQAEVVSSLEECAEGCFKRVLSDTNNDVKRVLLCSGKIFYDLRRRREELKRSDVAIVRCEQLYPLPMTSLREALAGYAEGTPAFWVQEEAENMGAWRYLRARLGCGRLLDRFPFSVVSRPESASPAGGSAARHKLEQERVVARAFEETRGGSA